MLGVGTQGPPAAATDAVPAADRYAGERDAWTVLAAVDGLGPVAFAALLSRFGSGREILREAARPGGTARLAATPALSGGERRAVRQPIAPPLATAIADAAAAMDGTVARVRSIGLRVVTMEEPGYPAALAAIDMPPHVLFVLGDPTALDRGRSVAIVGTRHATTASRTIAGRIATALSACGATVVSGLAHGIDGAAHEATVRAGGTTVAVIGGGHAVLSPSSHARLASAIVGAGGAVVSEHAPDVGPTKGTFPRRNRIISGLSEATVVVEAPARSGALITASWALEQGRECFLVPGPIDAPASAGCLAFLREFPGITRVVAGIPELVADLGLTRADSGAHDRDAPTPGAVVEATIATLGPTEAAVARHLVGGRITVDEVVAAGDLPVATVLAALAMLERRGLAAGVHGRYRPAGTLLGDGPLRRTR